MNENDKPLCIAFGLPDKHGLKFDLSENVFTFTKQSDEIANLLFLCNGTRSINEIARKLKKPVNWVLHWINLLEKCNIVTNAHEAFKFFEYTSSNPPVFGLREFKSPPAFRTDRIADQTHLAKLVNQRKSHRHFTGEILPDKVVKKLLAYMNKVPHAGALKGLSFYAFRLDKPWCGLAIPEENLLLASHCVVITANGLTVAKYGNRGHRYNLLEAGHAAQNAYLWGIENNAGILEYGGFIDKQLKKGLGVNQEILTILLIGKSKPGNPPATFKNKLEKIYHKWMHLIEKIRIVDNPSQKSQHAVALIRTKLDGKSETMCGNGQNIYEAQLKALAETIERQMARQIRVDKFCKATALTNYLDPNEFVPLSDEQYKMFPFFSHFDTQTPWRWVKGFSISDNREIYVPVDTVYYPVPKKWKICCQADSNGYAAHTNYRQAIQNAHLELWERHCFIRAWYGGHEFVKIESPTLKSYVQQYKLTGVRIALLAVNRPDEPAVVICIFQDQSKSGRVSVGGGASLESLEAAAHKAFYEAELLFLEGENDKKVIAKAQDVDGVMDHFYYYQNLSIRQKVFELWFDAPKAGRIKFNKVLEPKRSVVVNVYKDSDVFVVKVIDPDLIPLSFGYGREFYTHKAFPKGYRFPAQPHPFC